MINLQPAVLLDGSENHSHRTFANCSFTTGNFRVFVKAPFLNSISLFLFSAFSYECYAILSQGPSRKQVITHLLIMQGQLKKEANQTFLTKCDIIKPPDEETIALKKNIQISYLEGQKVQSKRKRYTQRTKKKLCFVILHILQKRAAFPVFPAFMTNQRHLTTDSKE